ncbi:MAG: hypothetical protein L7U62_03180 [Candidatus Poseidoniaceae archaeon]|nr:hypothetical protein [Candidatus Poseidoniaceae archaeon]
MTEKVRLEVLTTASQRDGVRLQIERCIEQNRNHFDFKLSQIPHIEAAITALKQGTGDLVAMSALNWREHDVEGLSIVGILPRREPTWVLVSDDKPEYLISKARVVCDHELLRRQMRRLRNDLELVTSKQFASLIGKDEQFANLDEEDRIHWIEECRQDGLLEGYIVARGEHAALKFKARRHTLGLQRENPERTHFVPPPLYGFTLLVARTGFPSATVAPMVDTGAILSHRIEAALLDSLSKHLHGIIGIFVEQRKFKTVLKEAQRRGDDFTNEVFLDSQRAKSQSGPSKWKQSVPRKEVPTTPRIEIKVETLNAEGTVSASVERICTVEESHMGMVNVLKEFEILLETMQMEHEEMVRKFPGLPDEYNLPRPALLNLETHQASSSEEE